MEITTSRNRIEKGTEIDGSIAWKSPSNIALIKYWGKHGRQYPRNPSISFTLQNSFTTTSIDYSNKEGEGISTEFYFENEKNDHFKERIDTHLASILELFPFLEDLHLVIRSSNSFPHSAGIASSASSMSALAMCLCSMEKKLFNTLEDDDKLLRKASYVARLGSGSASRSVYPLLALWGHANTISQSSNDYAIPYHEHLDDQFKSFKDTILIASSLEKSVSSTVGHRIMDTNIYANTRYEQARRNLNDLIEAMIHGDLERWGEIVEQEAMTLHALMMTSIPAFILMKENTLSIINKIWDFRKETKLPVYFTLDAGPNVHLLYPDSISEKVNKWINAELVQHCENGFFIEDQVGNGPERA